MKAAFKLSLVLLFILFQYSCEKSGGDGGGGGGGTPAEENISFTLDPEPGSTTTPVRATAPTYTFNVVINSAMPPQGVEVKMEFKKDSDGSIISQSTTTSSNKTIPVTVSNLPINEQGTVTVTVTSKSKASNTASRTFKLVRK